MAYYVFAVGIIRCPRSVYIQVVLKHHSTECRKRRNSIKHDGHSAKLFTVFFVE